MNSESKRLTLREIQLEELDILLKVRDFFETNGIRYMLCGGTLLGAVRHGGFIPWDDDIDVALTRKDFDKLTEIVREQRPSLDGIVFHLPGDEGYMYPYIKAVNPAITVDYGKEEDTMLWIDIFVLDHFPDSRFMHWLYLKRIITLERILSVGTYSDENMRERGYFDSFPRRMKMYLARFLYKLLGGHRRISRRMNEIARAMNRKYEHSGHVGGSLWPVGMNDYYSAGSIASLTKIKFEGYEFEVPGDYDLFLREFFGDYMTLPPEDKRQTHYIKAWR